MGITKDQITVQLVYPADPLGTIPGGIETFIRGVIKWAPEDISFRLIGVTTDRKARPVGKWTECSLGRRTFWHFPVFAIDDPTQQPKIPATLKLLLAYPRYISQQDYDILETHRIEPLLLYAFNSRPKTLVLHQNMVVINTMQCDIRWKYAPWLYRWLEKSLMKTTASVYAVKEDAVLYYQQKFPSIADKFRFVPTWVDTEVFFPAGVSDCERQERREQLFSARQDEIVLISAGRLDSQKNPLLLLNALSLARQKFPHLRLVMIGDGVLRKAIEKEVQRLNIEEHVILKGLLRNHDVAELVRFADLFMLSSVYEGMPICVLEALGSGIPVVTTDVGEIRKVVTPGINGEIAGLQTPESLSEAILAALDQIEKLRGEPCLESIKQYVPQSVLARVYENYRMLKQEGRVYEVNQESGR